MMISATRAVEGAARQANRPKPGRGAHVSRRACGIDRDRGRNSSAIEPLASTSSTRMEKARAFAFESRPDKNGDGPNSNNGSSAVDMRSVGIKHLKNKLSEYIRLAEAKPCWSRTGIASSLSSVHLRRPGAR